MPSTANGTPVPLFAHINKAVVSRGALKYFRGLAGD
jgi:hypothetical protein